MTNLAINQAVCTITVPFHGSELFVINHNGEPYTPMKPIVDGMGMDWMGQYTKLKQRFAKGIEEISIPTAGGAQKMICLALRKLAAWLNTISPNKVRPEIRERVIQYQEECDDVLYDYWTKGQVSNPRLAEASSVVLSLPSSPDISGKVLYTYEHGRIIDVRVAREDEHLISAKSMMELLHMRGFITITKDELAAKVMKAIKNLH